MLRQEMGCKKARPSTLLNCGKQCRTETRGALLGLEGGTQDERLDSDEVFPRGQDRYPRKFDAIVSLEALQTRNARGAIGVTVSGAEALPSGGDHEKVLCIGHFSRPFNVGL